MFDYDKARHPLSSQSPTRTSFKVIIHFLDCSNERLEMLLSDVKLYLRSYITNMAECFCVY